MFDLFEPKVSPRDLQRLDATEMSVSKSPPSIKYDQILSYRKLFCVMKPREHFSLVFPVA